MKKNSKKSFDEAMEKTESDFLEQFALRQLEVLDRKISDMPQHEFEAALFSAMDIHSSHFLQVT